MHPKIKIFISLTFLILLFSGFDSKELSSTTFADTTKDTELQHFLNIIKNNNKELVDNAIDYIDIHFKPEYRIMLIELIYLKYNDFKLSLRLLNVLEKNTNKDYGHNFNKWYEYIWNEDQKLTPNYHRFKAAIHKLIDSRFEKYFLNRQDSAIIRFDEIRWGGVIQDGIPPLRNPKMIKASAANYLNDTDVVFGIEVNGDVRAYPKRILAWHEMFTDVVGGISVTGVYCTLCGTVILYKNEFEGVTYTLGTSGFLYRSNKLMYDKNTQSLWNTIWGTPVVGPLAGKGIQLDYMSVVTTTWGEWKSIHPDTQVLSLNTGHTRDYGEGVAYKNYFSTDELMFNVPKTDTKLKNKQSILAIKLPNHPDKPHALSVKFLKKHPLYTLRIEDTNMVILTDKSGANRVYANTKNIQFTTYDQKKKLIDTSGKSWTIHEDKLVSSTGQLIERIATFNAFWFGWKAAYPETILIK